jgi:CRISPR/Cas system-associated exonuclease Cas4 (RecB family)
MEQQAGKIPSEQKPIYDIAEHLLDTEIYKEYARKRDRRRARTKFSASNAGFCPRATILNRLGAKETEPTARQLRIFWLGSVLHENVMKVLKLSGRLIMTEKWLNPDKSFVLGSLDCIIKGDNGEHILYELKSIHSGSFWTKIVKGKKPYINNLYQTITYWMLARLEGIRIDKAKVVYLSKQDSAMRSFWVDFSAGVVKEVSDWWDSVKGFWDRKELPPVLTEDDENRKWCDTCSFRTHYCFPESNDPLLQQNIELNIKQLKWSQDATESSQKTS